MRKPEESTVKLTRNGIVAAVLWAASSTSGLAFSFADGDLLLGFRQTGSASELVVNLGRAANFNEFARLHAGETLPISSYQITTLKSAFSDLSGVQWSAFGSVIQTGQTDPPTSSCWATRARVDLGTQTAPWPRRTAFSQNSAAVAMNSVGQGGLLAPGSISSTEVLIGAGEAYGYSARVGALGDFSSKWPGGIEGITPSAFVTSNLTNRLDLYYVPPDPSNTRPPGEYLGYFDFRGNGSMTFTAAGPTPGGVPTITWAVPG